MYQDIRTLLTTVNQLITQLHNTQISQTANSRAFFVAGTNVPSTGQTSNDIDINSI